MFASKSMELAARETEETVNNFNAAVAARYLHAGDETKVRRRRLRLMDADGGNKLEEHQVDMRFELTRKLRYNRKKGKARDAVPGEESLAKEPVFDSHYLPEYWEGVNFGAALIMLKEGDIPKRPYGYAEGRAKLRERSEENNAERKARYEEQARQKSSEL